MTALPTAVVPGTGIMVVCDYDHIVVGAGISGSSAAYQIAKRGAKVLLLEKRKIEKILCEEEEDTAFISNIINSFDEASTTEYEGQTQDFHEKLPYLNMGQSLVGYFDNSGGVLKTSSMLSGGVLLAHTILRAVQVGRELKFV